MTGFSKWRVDDLDECRSKLASRSTAASLSISRIRPVSKTVLRFSPPSLSRFQTLLAVATRLTNKTTACRPLPNSFCADSAISSTISLANLLAVSSSRSLLLELALALMIASPMHTNSAGLLASCRFPSG